MTEPPIAERGFCFECGAYRHQGLIGTSCMVCGKENISRVRYIPATELMALVEQWRERQQIEEEGDFVASGYANGTKDTLAKCADELSQVLEE